MLKYILGLRIIFINFEIHSELDPKGDLMPQTDKVINIFGFKSTLHQHISEGMRNKGLY